MIEGKTIARVVDKLDSPWIVFTDGTGIRISGYEGADYGEVTADEIAECEADLAERDAFAELRAAEQAAWMLRTCEERGEIRTVWLAARPKTLIPHSFEDAVIDGFIWDMNRTAFGGPQPKVKARCPVCNERECPNAPYMKPPNRGLFHQSATITIPVKV